MGRPARPPLVVVPALDEDTWFVASQSQPGVWRQVVRASAGSWTCGCPWGERVAEQLGVNPCAHLAAVADHLAAVAAGAAA